VVYRILSLDGGGAWALIQVKALMALFGPDTRGHDVLASFDLAAANSGGSLTLAGLLENNQLNEILDIFKDEAKRRAIFSPTRSPLRAIYKLFGLGPKVQHCGKVRSHSQSANHGRQPCSAAALMPTLLDTSSTGTLSCGNRVATTTAL
jgi:hypothetical protein